MNRSIQLALAVAMAFAIPSWCRSVETPTLKGRFVYVGEPPAETAALAVDPTSKGIGNILVYLRRSASGSSPTATTEGTIELTLNESGFNKRLVGLAVGQSLKITRDNRTAHSPQLLRPDDMRSPVLTAELEQVHKFVRPYSLPLPIACNLHPMERAFAFVHANRHFAITNKRGEFCLAELPVGDNEFQFWHELSGPLCGRTEWRKGRARVSMPAAEEIDLGEIGVSAEVLEKADHK